MTAQEEPVATSDAPKVGSLNIAITSFSINTSSIDNDVNISLPLWGRVVTKASDDAWIQSSNFAKSVGWAVPEGEADGDEAAAVEKFTFWPPEKSQSGSTEEETEAGEANNESWTWTNVANIMPDTVKQAMTENPDDADNAAAAAWEVVLKELGENESLVSSSDVDYPVADEGSIPTRSKAIPCTAEHVTAFVNTNFIIEVYKGVSRDPSTDTLVGTAIFGAEKWNGLKLEGTGDSIQRVLQYPGGVECALPVTLKTASNDGEEAQEPPLKSAPTVTVKVVADETLLQYCRGGRTFTALTSSVYLTNENGERAENVAAAWNLNDADNNSWEQEEFTIECSAPCNGSLEVSSVAGGRLCKQEAQTTADTVVEGGEKKEGEEEAKTDGTTTNQNMPDLQWSKPENPIVLMRTFIPKTGIDSLTQDDSSPVWEVCIKRKAPEGVESEEWSSTRSTEMTTFAEIGFLKEPGVSYFGGRFPLGDKLAPRHHRILKIWIQKGRKRL